MIYNEPLTTKNAAQAAPSLLHNDVDQRITKLRPMATPVDQISRYAVTRHVNSMEVDYYAVAGRPDKSKLAAVFNEATFENNTPVIEMKVADNAAFDVSETIHIPSINLTGYVTEVDRKKSVITFTPLNLQWDDDIDGYYIPRLDTDTTIVRMGRAAGELDVQTGQYEALPEKKTQNCQIFKSQVEQSTLMRRAGKEVGWTFTDQEEAAIFDMRLGMERSFLFGQKYKMADAAKKCDVYFTGGIWNQVSKEVKYTNSNITMADWNSVMSAAFTGCGGSAKKILIAGTKLVERLSNLGQGQNRVMLPGNKVTQWGLDFTEIYSKFGTLYVVHSEILNSFGHEDDGLIFDPEFLTKYVHTPFKAETLDLRTSGQRNTEAVVLTEISCLVLRNPEAHCKVLFKQKSN